MDQDAIISAYQAGETVVDIAKNFGRSVSAVYALLKRRKVAIRGSEVPVDLDELRRLHESGASVLHIAEVLGVSRDVVTVRLRRLGLQRRTASEAQFIRNARYTPEQRKKNAEAAHAAVRGKKVSEEALIRRAQQQAGRIVSHLEREVFERLKAVGLNPYPSYPVERFLIDLAFVEQRLAIEIDGGEWHSTPKKRAADERKEKRLAELGWTVIRFGGRKLRRLDEVVAAIQVACRNPPARGEEGVQPGDPEVVHPHQLVLI